MSDDDEYFFAENFAPTSEHLAPHESDLDDDTDGSSYHPGTEAPTSSDPSEDDLDTEEISFSLDELTLEDFLGYAVIPGITLIVARKEHHPIIVQRLPGNTAFWKRRACEFLSRISGGRSSRHARKRATYDFISNQVTIAVHSALASGDLTPLRELCMIHVTAWTLRVQSLSLRDLE